LQKSEYIDGGGTFPYGRRINNHNPAISMPKLNFNKIGYEVFMSDFMDTKHLLFPILEE